MEYQNNKKNVEEYKKNRDNNNLFSFENLEKFLNKNFYIEKIFIYNRLYSYILLSVKCGEVPSYNIILKITEKYPIEYDKYKVDPKFQEKILKLLYITDDFSINNALCNDNDLTKKKLNSE